MQVGFDYETGQIDIDRIGTGITASERGKIMSVREIINDLDKKGVVAFIVKINPEQKYFPKISSRVLENGSMESNPLHLMTPDLSPEKIDKYLKYFN